MVNHKVYGQVRAGADVDLPDGAANPVWGAGEPLEEGGKEEHEQKRANDDDGRQSQQQND
jgi:hypothetical protein